MGLDEVFEQTLVVEDVSSLYVDPRLVEADSMCLPIEMRAFAKTMHWTGCSEEPGM